MHFQLVIVKLKIISLYNFLGIPNNLKKFPVKKFFFTVYFSKHEFPFGLLATWIRKSKKNPDITQGLRQNFLRPCEALHQVKKQQIKITFWIWGSTTVYYNCKMCPIFPPQKSLCPNLHFCFFCYVDRWKEIFIYSTFCT